MYVFFIRYAVAIGAIVNQATAAVRAPTATRTRVVSIPNDASPVTPAPIVTPDDLRRRRLSSQICGYVSSYDSKKRGYELQTLIPPACSDGYTCDVDSQFRVINCANGHGGYTRPFDFGLGPTGFVQTCQDNSSPFAVSSNGQHASSIQDGTLFCGNGLPYCNAVSWTDMSASAWTCDVSVTSSFASGNFLRSSIVASTTVPTISIPKFTIPSLSIPSITGDSDGSIGADVASGVLSSAAIKIIATVVAIVVAFIVALILFCWRRARLKSKKSNGADEDQTEPSEPVTEIVSATNQPKATKHNLKPNHGITLNSAVPFRLYVHPAPPPVELPGDQPASVQPPSQDVSSTDAAGENAASTDVSDQNNVSTDASDQNTVSTDTPDQNTASTDALNQNNASTNAPDQNTVSTDTPGQNTVSTDALNQNNTLTTSPPISNPTSPHDPHASWLGSDESPSPLTTDTHHFPGRWLWDPEHRR